MDFTSLEEIYIFLEENIGRPGRPHEITNDIRRFADTTNDPNVKQAATWENYVWNFELDEGKVKPIYTSTKEDGVSVFEFPSYGDFSDPAYEYIEQRANTVTNDFLKIRYNQILWGAPRKKKSQTYAKTAVDLYHQILSANDLNKEEEKTGFDSMEMLKNGIGLAFESKYRVEDFKKLARSLLFDEKKLPDYIKIHLIDFLTQHSQMKKADYEGIEELVFNIGKRISEDKGDFLTTKGIYETGLEIAKRLDGNLKIWNKRMGDALVQEAEKRSNDETKMLPLHFYNEALPYYRASGETEKVKEIEKKYADLKKQLKLSKIEIPFKEKISKMLDDHFTAKVNMLLQGTPEQIIDFLTFSNDIFPSAELINKMSSKRTTADFVSTLYFDINKNLGGNKASNSAKLNAKIYSNYHMYIHSTVVHFLHMLFIKSQLSNKMNFETLASHFNNRTWFGEPLTETDSAGGSGSYKWIGLIAPSILNYFETTDSALKSAKPYTNYILAIDSLTIKFEGALRDFATLAGVSPTRLGKKGNLQEKYIEDLLEETELKKYFDENDMLLFSYLFTSNGMNLRNNVAHCFLKPSKYSFHIFHLVICAFLRLGKYKLTDPK